MTAKRLLVSKSNLFQLELDVLVRLVESGGRDLVAASHATERNIRCHLTAGIGEAVRQIECHPRSSCEFNQSARNRSSLPIVHLNDHGLRQQTTSLRKLFATARLNDGGSKSCGLGHRSRIALARAGTSQQGQTQKECNSCFHFFATSGLPPPFCEMRNAVRARASSSLMARFGSTVPGRRDCGFFIHW